MKTHIAQLASLLLGLIITACAGSQPVVPTQSQGCSSPTNWKIDFSLSGGIAGLSRSLSISSGGRAVLQDLRNGEIHTSTLSQEDLTKIAGMLAQACPFEGKQADSGCADCFTYKLNISMDDRRYALEASDINIPERSAPLIGYLGNIAMK